MFVLSRKSCCKLFIHFSWETIPFVRKKMQGVINPVESWWVYFIFCSTVFFMSPVHCFVEHRTYIQSLFLVIVSSLCHFLRGRVIHYHHPWRRTSCTAAGWRLQDLNRNLTGRKQIMLNLCSSRIFPTNPLVNWVLILAAVATSSILSYSLYFSNPWT